MVESSSQSLLSWGTQGGISRDAGNQTTDGRTTSAEMAEVVLEHEREKSLCKSSGVS